jgi:hypothetical protein
MKAHNTRHAAHSEWEHPLKIGHLNNVKPRLSDLLLDKRSDR